MQAGNSLVKEHHPDSDNIQAEVQELLEHWNALRQASARRSQQLDEVKNLLEFNRQADKVESWIKEKVLMFIQNNLSVCLFVLRIFSFRELGKLPQGENT